MLFSPGNKQFYSLAINGKNIPPDAIDIDDQLYDSLISAQATGARIVADANGFPILQPAPTPTLQEQLATAAEAVRQALQAAIDTKAREFGFSAGNALMLYAGFTNDYQALAQTFATWEVSVWTEANDYKTAVIAGTSPMLTPAQAVAMMPAYPTGA